MRTSILSRSVIAVASLAIGSVALAAVPATAATGSGITRDQVLTAVNALRATPTMEQFYTVIEPQFIAIARPSCNIAPGDHAYMDPSSPLVAPGQSADGILLKVYIETTVGDTTAYRQCAIAALASTNPALTLTGNLTLSGTTAIDYPDGPKTVLPPTSSALSADVFVSAPISVSGDTYIDAASFTANGSASRDIKVTTTTKVKDKKSKAKKKSAKNKYTKSLKSAKKSYAKALKKAGKSKAKKSAAKKSYSKKRALVKAKYRYSIAGYKLVKKTTIRTEGVPFALTAAIG